MNKPAPIPAATNAEKSDAWFALLARVLLSASQDQSKLRSETDATSDAATLDRQKNRSGFTAQLRQECSPRAMKELNNYDNK